MDHRLCVPIRSEHREEWTMASTSAEHFAETRRSAHIGVEQLFGVVGDGLNRPTDAARRQGKRRPQVSEHPRRSMRHAVLVPILLGAAPLGGCSEGILDPKGPIAAAERLLLINSTAIMLVVVAPVIVATLAFAWWYRASNPRASREPTDDYEGRIEFVTWSIPALIVILLSGVIWIGSHQLDPHAPIDANAKPLRVDVVALDWKWLFIYPDQGIAAVNELVMPAGTPITFRLTSATAMNSFFIPQLGSQIYTMGGMTTHLTLLADAPGEFPGFSAMYSGDGFSEMRFVAKSVPAGDFDTWVKTAQSAGQGLDANAYAALAKPSTAVAPATYRSVEPDLFQHIIDETVSGPGKTGAAWCLPTQKVGG
jgi:cytochrome o ubiquinol oxidase subunit 2